MAVRLLEDLPALSGRAVLVRATLDLPLGADEGPMAAARAGALGATLHWLLDHGAHVTVFGDIGGADQERTTRFAHVQKVINQLAPWVTVAESSGAPGMSTEDPDVLQTLIKEHDIFVNDSFQWSYLRLPSLITPASSLPSAAGRSLERDLRIVDRLLASPERPFVAILGGNRTFLRLHGLRGLVLRADTVLVGGAMAAPLLRAVGKSTGGNDAEDFLAECRAAYGLGHMVRHEISLPLDLTWSTDDGEPQVTSVDEQGAGQVVDIGPLTRRRFAESVKSARTVLWLGAMGRVEDPGCVEGTRALGELLGGGHRVAVVGGDALVSCLSAQGVLGDHIDILSATDAALELLKNGDLPALIPLRS